MLEKLTPHWLNQYGWLFCSNFTSTAGTHQEGTRSSTISSALVSDAACTCILNEYYTKFHTYYFQIISSVFRYLFFSKVIICPGLAWTSTLSL